MSGGQVDFFGYGGHWMQEEGFNNTFDVDIDKLPSKEFHTYRKTKVLNESIYFRWNPFNLVNKHYVRKTDDQYELVSFSFKTWQIVLADVTRLAKSYLPEAT